MLANQQVAHHLGVREQQFVAGVMRGGVGHGPALSGVLLYILDVFLPSSPYQICANSYQTDINVPLALPPTRPHQRRQQVLWGGGQLLFQAPQRPKSQRMAA